MESLSSHRSSVIWNLLDIGRLPLFLGWEGLSLIRLCEGSCLACCSPLAPGIWRPAGESFFFVLSLTTTEVHIGEPPNLLGQLPFGVGVGACRSESPFKSQRRLFSPSFLFLLVIRFTWELSKVLIIAFTMVHESVLYSTFFFFEIMFLNLLYVCFLWQIFFFNPLPQINDCYLRLQGTKSRKVTTPSCVFPE